MICFLWSMDGRINKALQRYFTDALITVQSQLYIWSNCLSNINYNISASPCNNKCLHHYPTSDNLLLIIMFSSSCTDSEEEQRTSHYFCNSWSLHDITSNYCIAHDGAVVHETKSIVDLPCSSFLTFVAIAWNTTLQIKQIIVNVQVRLCLGVFSLIYMQNLIFERKRREEQSRHVKTKKEGNVKHLEPPRDFTEARDYKDTPDSIQASEQSSCAGRHYRMGFAGKKEPAMVLQNHLNGILHCKLSSIKLKERRYYCSL